MNCSDISCRSIISVLQDCYDRICMGLKTPNFHTPTYDSLQPELLFIRWKSANLIFNQCSIYWQTRWLAFTSKMFETHLWKSDILSKGAGHRLSVGGCFYGVFLKYTLILYFFRKYSATRKYSVSKLHICFFLTVSI